MSRVTSIEMVIGLENPNLTRAKFAAASQNDTEKIEIASSMQVRWLTYPASKSDDPYSRVDLTLRSDDLLDWLKADALEERLLKLPDVSEGDAQQVVSCLYGQAEDGGRRPAIWCFVSEDSNLRTALVNAQAANAVSELVGLQIRSVKEVVDGMTNAPA